MNLNLMTAPLLEKICICCSILIGGGLAIGLVICLIYHFVIQKKGEL